MKFERFLRKQFFFPIIITLNIIDGNYLDIYILGNDVSK